MGRNEIVIGIGNGVNGDNVDGGVATAGIGLVSGARVRGGAAAGARREVAVGGTDPTAFGAGSGTGPETSAVARLKSGSVKNVGGRDGDGTGAGEDWTCSASSLRGSGVLGGASATETSARTANAPAASPASPIRLRASSTAPAYPPAARPTQHRLRLHRSSVRSGRRPHVRRQAARAAVPALPCCPAWCRALAGPAATAYPPPEPLGRPPDPVTLEGLPQRLALLATAQHSALPDCCRPARVLLTVLR